MFAFALGAFGSLIGSFLNVVIYRVPAGRSVVTPPSACGNCGHEIRWYDNIPVVSWLVLRAKCRDCGTHISARYPLIEIGTALFFALVALVFVPPILTATSWQATAAGVCVVAAFLYLASISVALSAIDLDTMRLPNAIVLPAYGVGTLLLGAAAALTLDGGAAARALIGAAAMGAIYFVLAVAVPGGMGWGDVKLAGALGLFLGFLGWESLIVGWLAGFIVGGLFGVVLLVIGRGKKTKVPFGPWMLVGAWVGVLAGPWIASSYLTLLGLV